MSNEKIKKNPEKWKDTCTLYKKETVEISGKERRKGAWKIWHKQHIFKVIAVEDNGE